MATNRMVSGIRSLICALAREPNGRVGIFLLVAVIALSKASMNDGSTVKLHSRLHITPLESTQPRSDPILTFMNMSMRRLTMVVRALLNIERAEPCMARAIASSLPDADCFS